jgi:sarcosine oxidase, subunit gamma
MPELSRQSALQDHNSKLLHFVSSEMELQVIDNISKVKLQVRSGNFEMHHDITDILGITLPDSPQKAVTGDPMALWCAPGEWLLIGNNISADKYREELSPLLAGQTFVVTDVSDSLTVIELRGEHVLALLAEGCGVDLHEDSFANGQYVLTRLAHLPVIIHQLESASGIQLYCDRSVARYLWDWLKDGIEKHGFRR